MARKQHNRNIRNIQKSGGTYYVTIPIDMVRALKWRERQKIEFALDERTQTLRIKDWKK